MLNAVDHQRMSKRTKRKKRETFSAEQKLKIIQIANRIFMDKFKGKDRPQVKMGLALGISQTSVSALLRGDYPPSLKVVESLATLAGFEDVRAMVGDYYVPGRELVNLEVEEKRFPNLRKCIDYHEDNRWPKWVLATAQAGYFSDDTTPDKWTARLDQLERSLKKTQG